MAVLISYCSIDERFIRANVAEASRCAEEVIVAVGDRLFDGLPEDEAHVALLEEELSTAKFVRYHVDMSLPPHERHNLGRVAALEAMSSTPDLVAFVDADEILDGGATAAWLATRRSGWWNAQKLASYWYFREPKYRAKSLEDSVLVVRREHVDPSAFGPNEREGLYRSVPMPRRRHARGRNRKVLVHHYSWVRTREQMLQKVRSWGHSGDRDWEQQVNKEFDRPFNGKDFVHGYDYEVVEPFADI